VDDNPAIRKLLASAFLSDGCKKCAEAGGGQEAIEVAKQIKPDIAILDLSMPVMDGLAAASELRKVFPPMPIILFTLVVIIMLSTMASNAGVSLVLAKTVPLPTLINTAHHLMGN
jgi:CheY-like chemotaxis protein